MTVPYTGGPSSITLDPQGTPMALGNIVVNSGTYLILKAGTYNVNSMKLNSNAVLKVSTGPVIFNVAGVGQLTPIDFQGGALSNLTYDPSNFRVLYAGSDALNLSGSTTTAAVVYAPAANALVAGNSDFYGSILAFRINVEGGSRIHYDRRLGRDFFGVGPRMMSQFTWKEY